MRASDFNLMASFYKHLLTCFVAPKPLRSAPELLQYVFVNDSTHSIYASDSYLMLRLTDPKMPVLGNSVKNAVGDYALFIKDKRLYAGPAPEHAPLTSKFDQLFKSYISERGSLSTPIRFNSAELERIMKAFRILGFNPDFTICSKCLYVHGCSKTEGLHGRNVTLEAILIGIREEEGR